jgi:hypothetical protein
MMMNWPVTVFFVSYAVTVAGADVTGRNRSVGPTFAFCGFRTAVTVTMASPTMVLAAGR